MKGIGVLFFIALVIPLVASEGDSDSFPSTTNNDTIVKHSNAAEMSPPDPVDAGEEKKRIEQGKGLQNGTKKNDEKDDSSENGSLASKTQPLRDSYVEECDPSNRCTDEKKKFIACLRVPGQDSLDLSLLIENRGTGSLDVHIVAPDFVTLEQAIVQLQAKEKKKINVSLRDGANDTMIVLKAGEGQCSLNLRNTLSGNARETSRVSSYINRRTRAASIFVFLAAVGIIGSALVCIKFWRRRPHSHEGSSAYQKVDMALPVSSGGKKEPDLSDLWDNNWGDGWDDDVEAPITPSKPSSTPSSKGLASRRSAKDGWKD
uniref:DUF7356 domain-containing protein n=1 Tax=Ananas comosus var. bracteatus TaxID=296719 RepID=A0A6V7PTV5_ANACO|nr:unnamed protein product [Ananas comosus var. bracteatus]